MELLLTVKRSEGIGINEVKRLIAKVLHRHKGAAGIELVKVTKPRRHGDVPGLADNVVSIAS